jgi:hypothetical protein
MPTKKNPKDWTAPRKIDLHPIPEHLMGRVGNSNILPKSSRLQVVAKHLPQITSSQQDKIAEAIEVAIRVYQHAREQDKRPKSTRVDARLDNLAHAASSFLKELLACDDHTAGLVDAERKNTPPSQIESDQANWLASNYYEDPMIPLGDLTNQVSEFNKLFERMIGSQPEKPGPRKETAFQEYIWFLAQTWQSVTGGSAKSSVEFVDLVSDVSKLPEVREIVRPTEDFRRKIQSILKNI